MFFKLFPLFEDARIPFGLYHAGGTQAIIRILLINNVISTERANMSLFWVCIRPSFILTFGHRFLPYPDNPKNRASEHQPLLVLRYTNVDLKNYQLILAIVS